MVTKNIKKILLNKDGNNFVADIENIVRSVNDTNADINGNVSITSVANATNATNATNAMNDGNGANIANTYIKLATPQTITAKHNFSEGVKISGYLVTIG